MYEPGEMIVYGRTGVCRVEDITLVRMKGEKVGHRYYVLKPLYQTGSITTPVDNNKVFSRPVISRGEAQSIIRKIPEIKVEIYHNRNLNQLKEHYRSCMEKYDCMELIRMTMSLYLKKREAEANKRKFGAVDERYMHEAEQLLFGELAVALEISRDDVRTYIERALPEVMS